MISNSHNWPYYEPKRKINQIQNRYIIWVWKKEIPSYFSGRPGTGRRRRLASHSQECSSLLQSVGRLQGGHQLLLICTWTWWFSCARKQTCTNKLIQIEPSGSWHIFWDWDTSHPPVISRTLHALQVERLLIFLWSQCPFAITKSHPQERSFLSRKVIWLWRQCHQQKYLHKVNNTYSWLQARLMQSQ